MYEGYQHTKFERDGAVMTIVISNPVTRNSINGALHAELPRAFAEVARDPTVRAVVLTGDPAGGAFCAGGESLRARNTLGAGRHHRQTMADGFIPGSHYPPADPCGWSDFKTAGIDHMAQVSMVIDFEKPSCYLKGDDL